MSATNNGGLVWSGGNVLLNSHRFLGYRANLRVFLPIENFPAELAEFGSLPPSPSGTVANIVFADDGFGTTSDACQSLVNTMEVSGRFALVDAGGCAFTVKAKNAQGAGAVGVIIANNNASMPDATLELPGSNPLVTVPVYSVTYRTRNALLSRLTFGEIPAIMGYDTSADLLGQSDGFTRMYAPSPLRPGSSVSHFDTVSRPNLLMEPIATDVFNTVDLTPALLQDIGWTLRDSTPNAAPVVNAPAAFTGPEDGGPILLTGMSITDADAGTLPLMVTFIGAGVEPTPGAGSLGIRISGTPERRTWIGSAAAINSAITGGWLGFTPPANYSGTTTIGIEVHDMGGSGTGGNRSTSRTLTFQVTAVNDAPTATAPAVIPLTEDTPVNINGINFDDVDGGRATVVLSVPSGTLSANPYGSIVISGTPTRLQLEGQFFTINAMLAFNNVTYTPALGASGDVPLSISINDQGNTGSGGPLSASASSILRIASVNNVPVAVNDSIAASNEDTVRLIPIASLLANDIDADGPSLSIAASSLASGTGVASLRIVGTDVEMTPVANFNGAASFTYRTSDGIATSSGTATVSFTINPVNDAPVANNDSLAAGNEDVVRLIPIASLVTNDTDVDNTTLSVGALTVGTGVASLRVVGSDVEMTPVANFNGAANFTYRTSDGTTGSADAAIVSFTITPVNDAPVAVNDSIAASNEDTVRLIPIASLVANDTDVDGPSLTIADASLALGTGVSSLRIVGSDVEMTPVANFNGAASFTYRTTDGAATSAGTATVNFTITPVNDAPVAVNDSIAASNEDVVRLIPVASLVANDTDADGTAGLTVTELTPGTGVASLRIVGSDVEMTPVANFNGAASFSYRTSDGSATSAGTATVNFTITPVNDAPVANNDSLAASNEDVVRLIPVASLIANDTDADGASSLSITGLVPGTGVASLRIVGSDVEMTPVANFNGAASFSYRASDGTATSAGTATVNFTITPVNDAPVAVNDSIAASAEDTVRLIPIASLVANDTDVDGPSLTIGTASLALGTGVASLRIVGSDVEMTPVPNFNGAASFSYRTNDGTATSAGAATVNFTITPVNDAPVANNDSLAASNEDTVRLIPIAALIANDTDADGTAGLTLSGLAAGAGVASLRIVGTDVEMTPVANFNGAASFTYRSSDGVATSGAAATVAFTINPVNDVPAVLAPASLEARNPGTTVIRGFSYSDVDAASGTVNIVYTTTAGRLVATTAGGVTVTGSGTVSVTLSGTLSSINAWVASGSGIALEIPTAATGAHSLSVTINDGGNTGSGGAQTRTLSVPLSLVSTVDGIFAHGFEGAP